MMLWTLLFAEISLVSYLLFRVVQLAFTIPPVILEDRLREAEEKKHLVYLMAFNVALIVVSIVLFKNQ